MSGETLSRAELARAKPVRAEGGNAVRAYCPFHGGDRQRSLRVRLDNGHFVCFSCGVWGYLEESRERYGARNSGKHPAGARPVSGPKPAPAPVAGCEAALARYQKALAGSAGAAYLESRKIPLELAAAAGAGYAAAGTWLNRNRDCPGGRLVLPHHDPEGRVVNLYGRAIGEAVSGALRHDHLPGGKGYFGARHLAVADGPVYVCEGPFDALSLMAAGCRRVIAIFGLHGWRWDWARMQKELIFALDADAAGQAGWANLGREAVLRGKRVWTLPPEAYGGAKDVNEAWIGGRLRI